MKNQTYRMSMLYDFYGDLLTDRQREFYDLYYNEDLSLAEIAENYGITRQGVRDVIVRAEAYLTEIEDKTGLIRRFHIMQGQLREVSECAGRILALNDEGFNSQALEDLAGRIKSLADTLIQE
ncbi:YlxM family DNA-binding protein [uncultured Intestinimonas sp.]|uniref:YlxM family DNA-binding protein n=1 Tax=uncultured Intestinimonas sp. TaxID=1689265 RepID=UPI0025D715FD|nr:sigma factor-like helix-turn-helix DNA-binding protein [uncultured Intestinimonas sp.]